jgi:hypothetical protein
MLSERSTSDAGGTVSRRAVIQLGALGLLVAPTASIGRLLRSPRAALSVDGGRSMSWLQTDGQLVQISSGGPTGLALPGNSFRVLRARGILLTVDVDSSPAICRNVVRGYDLSSGELSFEVAGSASAIPAGVNADRLALSAVDASESWVAIAYSTTLRDAKAGSKKSPARVRSLLSGLEVFPLQAGGQPRAVAVPLDALAEPPAPVVPLWSGDSSSVYVLDYARELCKVSPTLSVVQTAGEHAWKVDTASGALMLSSVPSAWSDGRVIRVPLREHDRVRACCGRRLGGGAWWQRLTCQRKRGRLGV